MAQKTFYEELKDLLNKHSQEQSSDTPDFILVEYMIDCLNSYVKAVNARDEHFGVDMFDKPKK